MAYLPRTGLEDMKRVKFKRDIMRVMQHLYNSPMVRGKGDSTGFLYYMPNQSYNDPTGFDVYIYVPTFLSAYKNDRFVSAILEAQPKEFSGKYLKAYKSDTGEFLQGCGSIRGINSYWCVVFALLLMAGVSTDFYDAEIDRVVDLAYCIGMDAALMRDFTAAARYVLEGNQLGESSQLALETMQARNFFLHRRLPLV